jgi:uncharacterized protein (DUF1800 family)
MPYGVRTRSITPQIRGGKAYAHRQRDPKDYVQCEHLCWCQHVGYVSAMKSGRDQDVDSEGRSGDRRRCSGEAQPTHSAGQSREKQSPPKGQRDEHNQAGHSYYWVKTPDAMRSVTENEARDGVEGARRRPLLYAKPQERPRSRGRSEYPCEDAVGQGALLEVGGAHGTKETTRLGPLKGRLTNAAAERLTNALPGPELMRRIVQQARPALIAAAFGLWACAHAPIDSGPRGQAAAAIEPRELTADQQVAHALNRLTFGPRPGDAEYVRKLGVDRWIAVQLEPERIRDEVGQRVASRFEMLEASPRDLVALFTGVRQARRQQAMRNDSSSRAEVRRRAMEADPDLRVAARRLQRAVADLQAAKVARAVASERQLQEVMVDFWENHFSVFAGKGRTRLFLPHYDRDVIRPHALGKFRKLLGAVARSPAMLFYLDNWQSAADSVHRTLREAGGGRREARSPTRRRPRGLNENYARELLELHTLGVDGGYTQQDVIEVARALTGWSIDQREGGFVFRPAIHDADEKVVLGHRLPGGRGVEDGEQVLDIIARHPATARHVARKLALRFVSDSPPPGLIARAAETFRQTDGDIRAVVRTIVTSPEFFSRAAYRTKVKSPFELVASALRIMNAEIDTTPRTAQIVARLGQPIFGRQTPDGWPETGSEWMNAGAILNRINFGLALAAGRVPGATLDRWPHTASLRSAGREAQVEGVVRTVLGGEASAETWTILRSGENPLAGRTSADTAEMMAADDMAGRPDRSEEAPRARGMRGGARALGRPVVLEGLPQVIGLALGAPEFQRR